MRKGFNADNLHGHENSNISPQGIPGKARSTNKRSRWIVIALIVALAGVAAFVLCPLSFSLLGEVYGLLLMFAAIVLFTTAVVLGIIAGILCHTKSKEVGRRNRFSTTSILLTFLGAGLLFPFPILLTIAIPDSQRLVRIVQSLGLLLLFVGAPVLGIIANVTSFRRKKPLGKFFAVILILFLIAVLTIGGKRLLTNTLPYIYTPPALTQSNLAVYNKCIEFAKNHNEYKDLMLARGGIVSIDGASYVLPKPFNIGHAEKVFSRDDVTELTKLCSQLLKVGCAKFQRDDDMLLFYKMAEPISPMSFSGIFAVLPVGPGVLYSLNGRNPNEVDSEILEASKAFVKINNNWYVSRRLMLSGPRSEFRASAPRSLIDRSLRIDGIDPNDLCIRDGR